MHHLCLLLLVLFLFYLIFLYLHNLLVLLNRVLLLRVGSRLVRWLDGALLLLIHKSLELFILHSLALRLLLLLEYQLPLLGLLHDLEILLLEIGGGCKDLGVLLIEFIAIHEHLIDISMKLAGMLIGLLPEIILHRFEVDGLQDDVEILRYT